MPITVEQQLEFVTSEQQPATVRIGLKRPWTEQSKQPFPVVPTGAPCLGAYANLETRQWLDAWAIPRTFEANPLDIATAGVVGIDAAVVATKTIHAGDQHEGWIQMIPEGSPQELWQAILCRTTEKHFVFARYEGGTDPTTLDELFDLFEATPEGAQPLEGRVVRDVSDAWQWSLPESWSSGNALDEGRAWYSPQGDPATLGISIAHVPKNDEPIGAVIRSALTLSESNGLHYSGAPLITPPDDSRFLARTFFHTTGTLNEAPLELAVMVHDVGESYITLTGLTPEMTIDSMDWARGKKAFQIACQSLVGPLPNK